MSKPCNGAPEMKREASAIQLRIQLQWLQRKKKKINRKLEGILRSAWLHLIAATHHFLLPDMEQSCSCSWHYYMFSTLPKMGTVSILAKPGNKNHQHSFRLDHLLIVIWKTHLLLVSFFFFFFLMGLRVGSDKLGASGRNQASQVSEWASNRGL